MLAIQFGHASVKDNEVIQIIWWRKTKNVSLVKKLENLKYLLRKNIQPRLAWEITFLKISMEDID